LGGGGGALATCLGALEQPASTTIPATAASHHFDICDTPTKLPWCNQQRKVPPASIFGLLLTHWGIRDI
jgi:hypothetical protein